MDMGMDEGANLEECDGEHLEAPKRSMWLARSMYMDGGPPPGSRGAYRGISMATMLAQARPDKTS